MDTRRHVGSGRSEQELNQAMRKLAATIREAGECLLDLQAAVDQLKLANEPALARHIERAAASCIREAMRH